MAKKKRNRHQQEPTAQNGGDSTESCDENHTSNSGECCWVGTFVELNYLKTPLSYVMSATKYCKFWGYFACTWKRFVCVE